MKLRGLCQGFILAILALLCSCSGRNTEDWNESFLNKFGEPVKAINSSRNAPANLEGKPAFFETAPTSPFLTDSAPTTNSNLPEDMFDLNYSTAQNMPFVALGTEFDSIEIPARDYYGVKAGLSEKSYMIAGNLDLQKDIDQINNERDADDIAISETLIKERKAQRQKYKMQRIFADDIATVEKEKIKEENRQKAENEARKKRLQDEDPINKAIALQVIQYNLQQNRPPDPNQNNNGGNKKPH